MVDRLKSTAKTIIMDLKGIEANTDTEMFIIVCLCTAAMYINFQRSSRAGFYADPESQS